MRHDADRLEDILEAIDAIERYAKEGRARFDADELVRNWVLRHIEIIGEAASRLSPEILAEHPAAPWREIVAMRNVLIHGYFDVDWEAVWAVAEMDIGPLRRTILVMLDAIKDSPS